VQAVASTGALQKYRREVPLPRLDQRFVWAAGGLRALQRSTGLARTWTRHCPVKARLPSAGGGTGTSLALAGKPEETGPERCHTATDSGTTMEQCRTGVRAPSP
jgi:hypothetical protein